MLNPKMEYWSKIIHATQNQIDACDDEESKEIAQYELDKLTAKIIFNID